MKNDPFFLPSFREGTMLRALARACAAGFPAESSNTFRPSYCVRDCRALRRNLTLCVRACQCRPAPLRKGELTLPWRRGDVSMFAELAVMYGSLAWLTEKRKEKEIEILFVHYFVGLTSFQHETRRVCVFRFFLLPTGESFTRSLINFFFHFLLSSF